MLDKHDVVFANGVPTESFFPGAAALVGVDDAARQELLSIFPEIASRLPGNRLRMAFPILEDEQALKLVALHRKRGMRLIAA